MPGSFDAFRISMRGLNASQKQMEVTSNNISQASNENYSRQEARLVSMGDVFDGEVFIGQGVEVSVVERIRDELLDVQIRDKAAASGYYSVKSKWLERVEAVYNEPSDQGVSANLSNFWDAWSELANDPEGLGTRSNLLSRTESLANTIQGVYADLEEIKQNLDQDLENTVGTINEKLAQLAQLNNSIFDKEAEGPQQANDLRDQRDAIIDELAKVIDIRYREESNGMVTVLFGDRPAVWINSYEGIKVVQDPLDHTKPKLLWQNGDQPVQVPGGELKALLDLRKEIVPGYQSDLNQFASTLINEVNSIYANGAGLEPYQVLKSELGASVLGLENNNSAVGQALGLLEIGDNGSQSSYVGEIHIAFYDDQGKVTRTQGVLVEPSDSLNDIITKLRSIDGFAAALVSDDYTGEERLQLQFDSTSAPTGEVGFSIANNRGGYDTSGFLDLVGFSADEKSSNDSSSAGTLSSADLSPLKAQFGVQSISDLVADQALGISGSFTLNSFVPVENEGTEEWHHALQMRIDVESDDTIQAIMDKVNALTSEYGFEMSLSGDQLELSNVYKLNDLGKFVGPTDADYASLPFMKVSFANTYLYPQDPSDEPPKGYNGLGDNTSLFTKMHLNTLLSGSDAESMALDSRITDANDVHAGYQLSPGANQMALDLNALQFQAVSSVGAFTIGQEYENIITGLGVDSLQAQDLSANEELVLQNFLSERSSISGVNMDEELTNMILFQRVYEANARMIATLSQMMEELMNI